MIKKLENGLIIELNNNNFTAKVVNSPNTEEDIIIPRSINYQSQEYIITSIGEGSFRDNECIDSILFPDDSELQIIESDAFTNSFLTYISFPSSLKCLKKGWCNSVSNLSRVFISPQNDHFKVINNSIIIGRSESENNHEFEILHFVSRKIKRFVVPSSIKYIDAYAFSECFDLREVLFEDNSQLISIDDYAFSNTPIESILFPCKLNHIGDFAFAFCYNLKSIVFPEESELKSLGNHSFTECPFESFVFPKHVTHVDENVFIFCNDLKSIEFANDSEVKRIGNRMFFNLNIEKILLPKSVTQIGIESFANCKELKTVKFEKDSELRSIDERAFSKSSIEKLHLPEKVDDLRDGWCCDVSNLTQISISPKNNHYSFINDSMIIGKTGENYDVLHFVRRDTDQIIIPSFIKHINSYACQNCSFLKKNGIKFDENSELISFGKFSFSNSSVETINIPKKVVQIEESAFSNCSNLLCVRFLEGLGHVSINKNAFFNSSIKKICFSSNVDDLQKNWCSKTPYLTSIEIPVENEHFVYNDNSMLLGKIEKSSQIFDILHFVRRDICDAVVPSYIKHINSSAFSDTHNLISVNFSDDSELCIIDDYCFTQSSIENILIPKKVTRIGDYSFFECKMLKSVTFANESELVSIGSYAFSQTPIDRILIPKNVHEIGNNAFEKCIKLRKVEFEENSKLEIIGERSFAESKIDSIIVPKFVCKVGKNAFFHCNNIKSIEFLADCFCIYDSFFNECQGLLIISFPNTKNISICQNDFEHFDHYLYLFASKSEINFI